MNRLPQTDEEWKAVRAEGKRIMERRRQEEKQLKKDGEK